MEIKKYLNLSNIELKKYLNFLSLGIRKYLNLSNRELQLVSAAFGFIAGMLIYTFFTPNYYGSAGPVKFELIPGSTMNQVIDSLYSAKIIANKKNLKIAAFLSGADKKLKAGFYRIPNGLTYFGLLDLLTEGGSEEQVLVTLPEGLWQHKMAQILQKEIGIDSSDFMKLSNDKPFLRKLGLDTDNVEGYLLPETYYFTLPSTAEEVIIKLKKEMDKIFTDSIMQHIKINGLTKHQVLTMASIIEGESNKPEEYATIAGVYYNRIKKGMKLQADPTIQYFKRQRRDKNRILYKDLEIDSPYNTYMYEGLPPGPINNPGKEAVLAAVYPEKNNFYYFVADGKGGHNFSRTYKEHLINQNNYRIWRNNQ